MHVLRHAGDRLRFLWNGPEDLPRNLKLEWRFVAVRSLLLPLTTILAGYLREQAQQAEAALQERLRQSNALNEVTGMLGASLELDAVLRASVAATAQLFGSTRAVLQASSSLDAHGLRQPDPIFFGGIGDSATERALERLCQQYARRGVTSRADDDL